MDVGLFRVNNINVLTWMWGLPNNDRRNEVSRKIKFKRSSVDCQSNRHDTCRYKFWFKQGKMDKQ